MQGEQREPGRNWGEDWAAASWIPATGQDPPPDAGHPGAAPVAGVSQTLEGAFAALRRSPLAVFGAGSFLGAAVLAGELAVWWVARGRALAVLPDHAALHRDPPAALAAMDRAQVLGAVVVVGLAAAACWVLLVLARTFTDAAVASAATAEGRVGAREALVAAGRRAWPLTRAGLLLGLVSGALLLPTLIPALWPSWGGLAAGVLLTGLGALGVLWLWVRSSLLGAELVGSRRGARAAWAEGGRLLGRARGSAVVLLAIGAAIAVAVGGAISSPLQFLTAMLWQAQLETGPFGWLERSWWDGMHAEVWAVAGSHALATAIGYPLLSVISALIWTERSEASTTGSPGNS